VCRKLAVSPSECPYCGDGSRNELSSAQRAGQEALRILCKDSLANFKVPKKFFIRPLLPLPARGKVDKMALQAEIKGMMD